ncbi:MAG: class I SAM-dependent methyltransferase [Hyphomicrobiaceae bacterium]|nr:MAG: class I SAM-dependent methyltransferase [Hyphomicrobiaceae bacterium]
MHSDVSELSTFYARPLGGMVRRLITPRVRARWRNTAGMTIVGLGFATPYLGAFRGECSALGALMPAGQGVVHWPDGGPGQTALIEDEAIPLADNSVDRLLAVHSLEVSDNPRLLLREMWRVLRPEGRLMIVVPNRRGQWARSDQTPFGQGRPYSKAQLERLLKPLLLTPVDWGSALFIPPTERRIVLRYATAIERAGARLMPAFSGLVLVEARKEVEALIGTAEAQPAARRLQALQVGPSSSRKAPRPLVAA